MATRPPELRIGRRGSARRRSGAGDRSALAPHRRRRRWARPALPGRTGLVDTDPRALRGVRSIPRTVKATCSQQTQPMPPRSPTGTMKNCVHCSNLYHSVPSEAVGDLCGASESSARSQRPRPDPDRAFRDRPPGQNILARHLCVQLRHGWSRGTPEKTPANPPDFPNVPVQDCRRSIMRSFPAPRGAGR